jgi:uncharacterized damage-inducible protein DinB
MPVVDRVVSTVFHELLDGAHAEQCWVLNPGDPGLLASLDRLSAEQASAPAAGGGPSVAAHVEHLRYGFELLNRWAQGEDPFAGADYAASWRRQWVSAEEWSTLREHLREEAHRWAEAMPRFGQLGETELTGVIAAVAHLGYHLGAIRQIARSTRGPQARD